MFKLTIFSFALVAIFAHVNAHMGLEPPTAVAGERTIVTLRIGHDCGDDTIGTTNFTMVLPPGLPSVSVEQMPQWRTIIHKKSMNESSSDMGKASKVSDEYVSAITYIGFLPDGFFQLFNVRIKFPDAPGAVYWFKGYQDCHNQGTSLAWEMIPSEEEPKPRYPARSVTLVAPSNMTTSL